MSIVGETFGPRSVTLGPHSGIVVNSVENLSDMLYVVLPTYDSQFKWGPCPWTPRGTTLDFPQGGDRCLVVFDETRTPWVVSWWPF